MLEYIVFSVQIMLVMFKPRFRALDGLKHSIFWDFGQLNRYLCTYRYQIWLLILFKPKTVLNFGQVGSGKICFEWAGLTYHLTLHTIYLHYDLCFSLEELHYADKRYALKPHWSKLSRLSENF